MMFERRLAVAFIAAIAVLVNSRVMAQQSEVANFYQGKTISILCASAPGGAYDMYARLISRHYGQFIPGSPSIVVRNLPGSMRAAQTLFNVSPKGGTELGVLVNNSTIIQLMRPGAISIRAENFVWIGSVASPSNVLAVWHTTGVRNVADAKEHTVAMGSSGAGSNKEMVPRLANHLLGTKFKVVSGYQGSAEIGIALERGEIGGDGSTAWSTYLTQRTEWVESGKIVPIVQMAFARAPEIPNVPTLFELAQNEEQQNILRIITTIYAIGTTLTAPPGLSPARAEVLRRGFDQMIKDPAFLADAKKTQLEVSPTSGREVQDMVARMISSSPETIEKFRRAVSSD
jgi:tripartite-type tricarboxylate transporter receptor subunit TctC